MFTGLMTGVSGIRGIIGQGMTPEVALLWSGGFGTWVKGGKVVVGMDTRQSGAMLSLAVKAGLVAAGCDVDDIGIVATPECALAVERRGAAGGIIITASHNPQEWNALKFVRSDGRMLTAQDFANLERIVTEGPLKSASWDRLGSIMQWDGADYMYISSVTGLGILDLEKIKRKQFKVAMDCVNGSGSKLYPQLLEALSCEVITIYSDSSGSFPRPPEPKPENIGDLSELVKKEGCDVGFAVDPDGDRLAAVDDAGEPLGEELTLALAVRAVLDIKPGPVVVNSLTSQIIEEIAASFGVQFHRTRVGEANVAAGMKELKAVVGGEGNGGVIFPELHLTRDSGVGMALILNYLSGTKKKLSEIRKTFPEFKMFKVAYPLETSDADEIIQAVSQKYDHDQLSRIDGLRVTFDEGWVQVRSSNTEPILRVYSESKDESFAREMLNEMLSHLNRIVGDDRMELQ